MKKLIVLLALMFIPAQLRAFTTQEALGLVAMPLAVAAVSDVPAVPQDQLTEIVTTLNDANVAPVQFVEVVRYIPVTYGQTVSGPTFAEFVRTETSNGITGRALVTSITRRLHTTYNVTPRLVMIEEPTTFVVQRDYIPVYTTAYTTYTNADPLALVALPLAVAAVSDVSGVPQNQLADLVLALNDANVPVVQEIQVVRYAPVALTVDSGRPFVEFVQTQVSQGITGPALVPVVTQRIQTFVPDQRVILTPAPQRAVIDERFIEPVVVTHPHGGPPGQIKKELGLQTGAEVVHGGKPGRQFIPAQTQPPMASSAPPAVRVEHNNGRGHGEGHAAHGEGRGHGRKNVEFVAPPAPPVMVQQPAPAVVAQPAQGQGKGHEGGEGQGKGKGHERKDH